MNEPKISRWAGVCAGGYYAAAAVYLGNVFVLATVRRGDVPLVILMGGLPVICATMGSLVLSNRRWVPKWAVVVAAGFAAIHLIGLAYLFLVTPASISDLSRSLQWQLGVALLFLWLSVFCSAFRLAKCFDSAKASPPI